MKKVLVINTVSASYNGITSVILNFAKATAHKIEYEFLLCAGGDEGVIGEFRDLGRVTIPPYLRSSSPISYTLWLKKQVKVTGYDAVHVHGNSGTMYFDVLGAQLGGCKRRIVHSHSSSCTHGFVHKVLKPFLNNGMTVGIACSDLARDWLFTKKSRVVYNGIDVERYKFSPSVREEYRKTLGIDSDLVIGHVGYMDGIKNHRFLISAFAAAVKKNPHLKLLLIGDGDLRPQVEEQIAREGLADRVVLLGKRGDVDNIYQAMDIFVLPSVFEGLPVTLIEAQSCGLPCIASSSVTRQADVGGVRFLGITDNDVSVWADALAKAEPSPNRAEGWTEVAKTDFNISVTAEKLLELYGC